MIFVFDIDGTILYSKFDGKNYYDIVTRPGMLIAINNLYDQGHTIILQTARHWDKFEQTKKQLQGFKYHNLIMGNIPADYYINDRGFTPDGFINLYEANLKKEKEDG